MITVAEEFKNRFVIAMNFRDMKAVDIAKRLNVKEGTISHYKSGYSKPKRDRLVKLANILEVDPSWLLGLDVPMLPSKKHHMEMGADAERRQLNEQEASDLMMELTTGNQARALKYLEHLYAIQCEENDIG